MLSRRLLPPLIVVVASVIAAVPPQAADGRVIGRGVSAGGVPLSGLTVDQATSRLQSALGPHLARDVIVRIGARAVRLTAGQAGLRFDPRLTAVRAQHAVADAAPIQGTRGGTLSGEDVPLALSHSRVAVAAFARRVARRSSRPARNATVRITTRRMVVRRARHGRAADAPAAARAIDAALDSPTASRVVRVRLALTRPAVNVNDLRRRYSTVITVDRSNFTLRLFKRLRLKKRYPIAVGMAGLETPAGRYRIQDKQVNPAWHVPNRAWAGSLAGQTIPGGTPQNPLKARWLGIADGVGIHGTAEDWSIGSAASHGCIRMRIADVIDLFRRIPVGTTVLIR